MYQPRPEASQAVLIGSSRYAHLHDLPAIDNNLTDLAAVLTDRERWGLPPENLRILRTDDLSGADASGRALEAIKEAAARATDGLVVYFGGHGLIDPDHSDELFLAMHLADEREPYLHTLPYSNIAHRLKPSRAPRRVVILDCCFAGRALNTMSGSAIALDLSIGGACVLAAAPATRKAISPEGARHSAFTGELLRFMRDGVPDGPPLLDMTTLWTHVHHALDEQGRGKPNPERPPLPLFKNESLGGQISLVTNRTPFKGAGPPPPPPPPPAPLRPAQPSAPPRRPPAPPLTTMPRGPSFGPLWRRLPQMVVVSVVLAGLAFAAANLDTMADGVGTGITKIKSLLPQSGPDPDQVTDSGKAVRKIEGYGFRYEVARTIRTQAAWGNKRGPSITVVAYVTRTSKSKYASMQYRFSASSNGAALEGVPFQGTGDGDPPVNQRSRLVSVLWDTDPNASAINITLHDFYWPGDRDLVLRKVRIPVGS